MDFSQHKQLTILAQKAVSIGRRLRGLIGLRRQWTHLPQYFPPKRSLTAEVGYVDGPTIVQVNLLKGLDRIGQSYRFNPPSKLVTPYVGVLSNIKALRWAMQAKRDRIIERLVAGPNLVVTPLESDGILCAPEIDVVVTPCRWVREWYVSLAPQLESKVMEWPAGIDTDFWYPDTTRQIGKLRQWLIYDKTKRNKTELKVVQSELERRGQSYEVIVYGQYTQESYRSVLRRSKAMVMLSPSESQGIAQFEAWGCDVPVLVWDRHRIEWKGLVFDGRSASSSPYLSVECGMRFLGQHDLANVLDQFINNLEYFTPREYVLQNFSLSKAALSYVNIFRR